MAAISNSKKVSAPNVNVAPPVTQTMAYKQMQAILGTASGQQMLKHYQQIEHENKVQLAEYESQAKHFEQKLYFNEDVAKGSSPSYIKKVLDVVSIVETDGMGNVSKVRPLKQSDKLESDLMQQLASIDNGISYSMFNDGVFSNDMSTQATRLFYQTKAEFENKPFKLMDLTLNSHDDEGKQKLSTYLYETSPEGKRAIGDKVEAYKVLAQDKKSWLGMGKAVSPEELKLANDIINPQKPFGSF